MSWRPVQLDQVMLESAWDVQDRFQLSFRDALIVAAARAAGCGYLLTEDLQDGQVLDDLRVVNPFLHQPAVAE
jgi:predicted nucleic acid-binding protein